MELFEPTVQTPTSVKLHGIGEPMGAELGLNAASATHPWVALGKLCFSMPVASAVRWG